VAAKRGVTPAECDWPRAHKWWQVPLDEIWRRAEIIRSLRHKNGPHLGPAAGQQVADTEPWTTPEIRLADLPRLGDA
jgi:hypothetical protein